MVKVRWHDKEFERTVLDPTITRFLTWLGLKGAALAQVITNRVGAVDTGALLNSITHEVQGHILRIGTNISYAIYVFLGTARMRARPILRMMLFELKSILRGGRRTWT